MCCTRGAGQRLRGPRQHVNDPGGTAARALRAVASDGPTVLLLGMEDVHDDCWAVLEEAGVQLKRVEDVAGALCALTEVGAPVVIAGARWARALITEVRGRREYGPDVCERNPSA